MQLKYYLRQIFSKREKYYWKALEYSGWGLFGLFLLYFISGYGITKGIMDKEVATLLHEKYLPVPAIVLFVIHSGLGARVLLRRMKLGQDKVVEFFVVGIFLVILAVLLYLHFR